MGRVNMKFGRRPPKRAAALRLGELLTGVIPAHPVAMDYLADLTHWEMLGNDQYGDCVAVMWSNMRRLVTAALGDHEVYPNLAQVLTLYRTQNPNFPSQDDGMDIQTMLEHLVKVGGPDGVKALAFAQVNVDDEAEVDAAMAIFGSLCTGITVRQANETEFDLGRPWDYQPGSPIAGGHAILAGGYTPEVYDAVKFITWGAETALTDAFLTHEVDEAWVVIWPEHLGSERFLAGIDMDALASAYAAITGRPFPDVPRPGPSHAPDTALADAVRVWSLAPHRGPNRRAALAVQAWMKAKGL